MTAIPTVKRLMTPFPYAVEAQANVAHANGMMAEHEVRHLPVTRDGVVVGILSQRELSVALGVGGGAAQVWDICTRDPYIVDHEAPADEVAAAMAERHLGSAIVLHHGNLAGIVTTTDICRDYAAVQRERRVVVPDETA